MNDASPDMRASFTESWLAMTDCLEKLPQAFDPVRHRLIAELLERAQRHSSNAAEKLQAKIANQLQRYQQDLLEAQQQTKAVLEKACQQHPNQSKTLTELYQNGDFSGLKHQLLRLPPRQKSSLAKLVDALKSAPPVNIGDDSIQSLEEQLGLSFTEPADTEDLDADGFRALHQLRQESTRRNAINLVSQINEEVPEYAGPMNPERLAVNTISKIRELSPSYLIRFVAYAETLLWLEQTGKKLTRKATKKKTAR